MIEAISSKKPLKFDVNNDFNNKTLKNVLESFLDSYKSNSTRNTYARSFKKLIQEGIILCHVPLSQFIDLNHSLLIEEIKNTSRISEGWKKNCLVAYLALIKFIRNALGIVLEAGENKKEYYGNTSVRKCLSIDEWILFLSCLRKINERDALIAEVLNWANGFFRNPDRHISLKEVLDLHSSYIGTHNLTFWRLRKTPQGALIFFPDRILDPLRNLCCSSRDLVFVTSSGRSVRENQVKRNFSKASKEAGIRNISPAIVRIPVQGLDYCPFCEADCVCI